MCVFLFVIIILYIFRTLHAVGCDLTRMFTPSVSAFNGSMDLLIRGSHLVGEEVQFFLYDIFTGGDGGDNSNSKNQIVMKSNEWKFRVTCRGLFYALFTVL